MRGSLVQRHETCELHEKASWGLQDSQPFLDRVEDKILQHGSMGELSLSVREKIVPGAIAFRCAGNSVRCNLRGLHSSSQLRGEWLLHWSGNMLKANFLPLSSSLCFDWVLSCVTCMMRMPAEGTPRARSKTTGNWANSKRASSSGKFICPADFRRLLVFDDDGFLKRCRSSWTLFLPYPCPRNCDFVTSSYQHVLPPLPAQFGDISLFSAILPSGKDTPCQISLMCISVGNWKQTATIFRPTFLACFRDGLMQMHGHVIMILMFEAGTSATSIFHWEARSWPANHGALQTGPLV